MRVKICGLTTLNTLSAAINSGATYVGFVFFEKSPRHLTIEQAIKMANIVPDGICKTALVVDPSDKDLDDLLDKVPVDMIQLHGHESAERVSEVKDKFGLPVMKAVGISDESDLVNLYEHSRIADQILVDAKPPKNAVLPGGNGLSFDWKLLAGRRWSTPWMLAGGLNSSNLLQAAKLTGARQFDVSSGVETSTGVKDIKLISDFIQAANGDP
ncbi:phosphoribosylanthranilate isomerase [Amylibacter sp.]|jgi:phosphoribosylanthranilate isomerase|nr:phosphoribosylanthranilate isomerase [Amylibacter sp.]MDA8914050.1 phosphoribosylanthranilate isomerase [Amylibacter sp.]MDA9313549.1 phosphoribosylanthranilate isomerase [Amylibacter sp.]MDB0014772.1 phosphoribosylanthranilate isomerase [Amylibacter sp.]MDB2337557.1 phosphoribosylanthranilate isomerase [Amylibacter sp.]|tara:strand:- start:1670 stop:2308 length:639 start_codon:yes stop_codon:yes gene_type:complete